MTQIKLTLPLEWRERLEQIAGPGNVSDYVRGLVKPPKHEEYAVWRWQGDKWVPLRGLYSLPEEAEAYLDRARVEEPGETFALRVWPHQPFVDHPDLPGKPE